ncbi:Golgi-specific brefeldin A-resistance guanine nucleotide exchange factor 1 [Agrilus planipennis]|uniref:Golgi-specific brefeldin A-resistance guanine nucleotide exchange factor 1 n=1 Tax=Agrilus planipennis TaxID=224129 RepID=A0A7F5RMZ9_AGRPL|nr:Golgi-specific brefeldin A-resistance guanine nucleotide exchange factor 1 [Agrilus planipennis]
MRHPVYRFCLILLINFRRNDEIVMPAEHTGLVKENYLWKVLLRRGSTKEGVYYHTASDDFDENLFSLIWGPVVSALSFVFSKSEDVNVYKRALNGFESCASISAHFTNTKNLDMLVLTLCKFTMLHNTQQKVNPVAFGASPKAQAAFKAVFAMVHQHGDNVREGWKHVLLLILSLYNANLVPKTFLEVEDFTEPDGKILLICEPVQMQKQDSNIFSSLYSYMVSSSSSENLNNKMRTIEEQQAEKCIEQCNLDQLITDSKFLHEEALQELVKALIDLSWGPDVEKSLGCTYNENVTVFFLELLLKVVIQNRDRVMSIWQVVHNHLYTLIVNASHLDYQFLLERSVVGLLRLAIRLMRNEEMSPAVVQSLRMLLLLKTTTLFKISIQISCGLYELLKTSAQNIHTNTDWSIIFTLLECVGAGALPPKPLSDEILAEQELKLEGNGTGEEEVTVSEKGYQSDSEVITPVSKDSSRSQSPVAAVTCTNPSTPVNTPTNHGGWILLGAEGEIQPVIGRTLSADQYGLALDCNLGLHKPKSLLKCCESLAFLVRDVAHITPYNFDNCVHCVRTFVEASLNGGKIKDSTSTRESRSRKMSRTRSSHGRSPATSSPDEDDSEDEYVPSGYYQTSIQLLDLMHTLHTRTAQIFRWWAEEGGEIAKETSLWGQGWCPLLQGIARLCCDNRRQVRMSAITYLQRALLVHDLQTLNGPEWEACFHRVLFPLLSILLEPIGPKDPQFLEETRIRAATLLSKVFLHHLTPLLSLPTFSNLWLNILDFMDKYMHADKSDLLYEAIPESLKNMLLVMESANVFKGRNDSRNQLWFLTWERISIFLPNLKQELFNEREQTWNIEQKNMIENNSMNMHPQSTTIVTQHNVENATRSSIILQPPSLGKNVASSLFSHLGQMVSTPIVPPEKAVSETSLSSNPLKSPEHSSNLLVYTSATEEAPHVFPVLYSSPKADTTSLYGEYIKNPYHSVDEEKMTKEVDTEEKSHNFEPGSVSLLSSYFGTIDSGTDFAFPESKTFLGSNEVTAENISFNCENNIPEENIKLVIN